ncbi:hypothetical protein KVR01_006326 [Diaporthe batatas]|uniref:uncharacterized protein n=1 Tax=Diaporthe batatas TaxID=748121 RepID=UPI001D05AFB6|nr:uncharacterized protein KVR01_006326 [Diaporthe batatas]KAG8164408.1 hypothetical protein KVR01_006326 [Diaporthe batatas]
MTSNESDGYVFQRNANASSRLHYQYYLWQDTFRFHLHPDIPQLEPDARIADVATGTGIWLSDLSRQLPSTTQLHGLDISLDQLPPPNLTPPNATYHEWDLYTPPPAELRGIFDVVHMRLIGVVIKDAQPARILANVAQLLRPGGYLQWEERYTPEARVMHGSDWNSIPPADEFPGVQPLYHVMNDSLSTSDGSRLLLGSRHWLDTLERTIEDEGFEEVRRVLYRDAPAMGMFWNDVYVASVEELTLRMLGVDPVLGNELQEMIERVETEKRMGVWLSSPKAVFLGRRKG